ncbi:MAG TPA: pectin acetylesterase-family hydrolase [Thermoanaerobaculia bacterium]
MRLSSVSIVLSALSLLIANPSQAQPANSCADPYWKYTLRCAFFPTQLPQPVTDEPQAPEDLKDYTRVFLTEDTGIRCMDGTAPLMYVDKAICTNLAGCDRGARYGDPIESNRWLFTVPGGGSCAAETCAEIYAVPDERGEMGSAGKPSMKNMDGIHLPDPKLNPVFASYNRVRIEKCSYDRYMGRAAQEAAGGYFHGTQPGGGKIDYNLYYHGFLIIEQAFKALENGLHYSTWRLNESVKRRACCSHTGATTTGNSGQKVIHAEEKLPPLADAEVVLFAGHSGGCHGLFHNIDNIAATLAGIPGFKGDVRALFDENFLPSVENEAAFASTAPGGSDAYSGITSGVSSSNNSGRFTYDASSAFTTDLNVQQYNIWHSVLDASCMEVHGATEPWKCADRHHVLLNHIGTPFLAREDFRDPNTEHLNGGKGHQLRWAAPSNYPNCPSGEPCDPILDAAEFRARLEEQASTFLQFAQTRSEIGKGTDRTFAVSGTLPTSYLWMPQCARHDGAYDNASFYKTVISTSATAYSLRQWLEQFMSAPRLGVRAWQIDGLTDSAGRFARTTQCQ